MEFADHVQETTTSTSSAVIALAGAVTNLRPFNGTFSIGATGIVVNIKSETSAQFLTGEYTLTDANTLTRTKILDSSNAGADVTFAAGTKKVTCVLPASIVAKMLTIDELAFNTSIPLSTVGMSYMAQYTVNGAIGFAAGATRKRGAKVEVRLVSDGVNTPTFSAGMLERGGSAGYDYRPGIVNIIEFFYDGYDVWYAISQAQNPVAIDLVAPTVAAPFAVVDNATPTLIVITHSEVLDSVNNPPVGAYSIPGHPITSTTITGATVRLITSTAITGGESLSVTYAPTGVNNVKDPSGNQVLGFTQAITNNVIAADTTAPVLSGLTATATGPTTASGSVTTNEANGTLFYLYSTSGTATVPALEASSTSLAISSTGSKSLPGTGLTASTQYYLHALHRDTAGNKAASVTTFGPFTTGAAATVPDAPTIGTAVAGAGYVDVAFTPGSDGGAAIIDHTATLSTGETATGASSPIRVTTSTTVARTANVKSRNSQGTGPASAESNSVTPSAAPDYPRFVAKDANLSESGSGPYTYTGVNAGTYVDQRAALNKMFGAAGVDGGIKIRYEQISGNGFTFGISNSPTQVNFASMAGINLVIQSTYYAPSGGSPTNHGANMVPMEGDIWYYRRVGTALHVDVARAATPTVFVPIGSWPSGINTTVNKYFNLVVASDAKFTLLEAPGMVPAV